MEVVGYERKTGGWDVYVNESIGTCPELEAGRVDDEHIFIETIISVPPTNARSTFAKAAVAVSSAKFAIIFSGAARRTCRFTQCSTPATGNSGFAGKTSSLRVR